MSSGCLTRVIYGHVHDQLVARAAVQPVGAHSHNLDHIAGVGHQVLDYCPLVAVKKTAWKGYPRKYRFLNIKKDMLQGLKQMNINYIMTVCSEY